MLVSVHGYAGDAYQIDILWPAHVQHGAPVAILSPDDSPIYRPGAWCKTGGKRAYIGPDSLDRQWQHLNMLLDFDVDWYLANDSDSCLLSPGLPEYILARPDVLWANKVSDAIHVRPPGYPLPQIALQPPYVFSRKVLERLVSKGNFPHTDTTNYGKYGDKGWVQTPYIDWYMMALAFWTGVPTENFLDGASCPTVECNHDTSVTGAHHSGLTIMRDLVRNKGVRFVHAIKSRDVFEWLCQDRTHYALTHGIRA